MGIFKAALPGGVWIQLSLMEISTRLLPVWFSLSLIQIMFLERPWQSRVQAPLVVWLCFFVETPKSGTYPAQGNYIFLDLATQQLQAPNIWNSGQVLWKDYNSVNPCYRTGLLGAGQNINPVTLRQQNTIINMVKGDCNTPTIQTGLNGPPPASGGGKPPGGGSHPSGHLSNGATAGIVVGVLFGVTILAVILFFITRPRSDSMEMPWS